MKKKVISLLLIGAIGFSFVGCSSVGRMSKSFESNTKGLHRVVKVLAMDGTVVETYESKSMLVTDGDGGTITLDFDGRRVVLCNSQVIIEEK